MDGKQIARAVVLERDRCENRSPNPEKERA
jgi:hypothetical protein